MPILKKIFPFQWKLYLVMLSNLKYGGKITLLEKAKHTDSYFSL